MAALLGDIVAGGMSGGAAAEDKVLAAQRQADIEKQLIQTRAQTEADFQQATEQRHIKYAANLRTAMSDQVAPQTEAILNAQGKTSLPPAPSGQAAPSVTPGANLTATDTTPGAPATPDYSTAASGLLAGPNNIPATPVAQKQNYVQATPTEQITATALAMLKNGWLGSSDPDAVLKAMVTLNDNSQNSQTRLDASKSLLEAKIYGANMGVEASRVRGENAANAHFNNPTVQQHNKEVDLRGQAENLRKQANDQYKIMTDPLATPSMKTQAASKKDAIDKVLTGVMSQQESGQNPDSVVQSQSQNAVSWDSLAK